MVRLFEGFAPDLELKTFSGFGDVKGWYGARTMKENINWKKKITYQ